MSCGNHHAWGAVANGRKAFEAHSDTCEWPKGCDRPSKWYYTSITGRWSVCDQHCPVEYRTHPIAASAVPNAPPPAGQSR